jgi:hypothetical protein
MTLHFLYYHLLYVAICSNLEQVENKFQRAAGGSTAGRSPAQQCDALL